MIPHFIINEKTGLILQFKFDFKNVTTVLSLQKQVADGFEVIEEKTVDDLLRHAVSIGDRFYVATMKVRKWGSPAFVEEWSWETLSPLNKHLIQHNRFGLMNFTISAKGDTVLIDRFFVEEDDNQNGCKIFSFPDFTELGWAHMNSNLQSPTFDETGDKLVLVHTDQGSAETMLFERKNGKFEKKFEFAEKQVTADMTFTSVAYTKQGIVLLSRGYPGEIGLYDIHTGDCKFLLELEKSITSKMEDADPAFSYDNLELIMSNADLTFYTNDAYAYVGSVGSVLKVNLTSGTLEATIEVPGLLFIVQLKKLGQDLIAIDSKGLLKKITL